MSSVPIFWHQMTWCWVNDEVTDYCTEPHFTAVTYNMAWHSTMARYLYDIDNVCDCTQTSLVWAARGPAAARNWKMTVLNWGSVRTRAEASVSKPLPHYDRNSEVLGNWRLLLYVHYSRCRRMKNKTTCKLVHFQPENVLNPSKHRPRKSTSARSNNWGNCSSSYWFSSSKVPV